MSFDIKIDEFWKYFCRRVKIGVCLDQSFGMNFNDILNQGGTQNVENTTFQFRSVSNFVVSATPMRVIDL